MDMERPIIISIFPSRLIRTYLFSSHLFFIIVIILLEHNFFYKILIVSMIISSMMHYWSIYSKNRKTLQLSMSSDNKWEIANPDSKYVIKRKLLSSYVCSLFILLRFESNNKLWPHIICVAKDSVNNQAFKALRVYCRNTMTSQ